MRRIVPAALVLGLGAALVVACGSSTPAPIAGDGDDDDASTDAAAPGSDATTPTPDANASDAAPGDASALDSATDDASTDAGASDGSPDSAPDAAAEAEAGPTTPTSVTITGTYTVNCTDAMDGTELDCDLVVASLTSTPPPPAGRTVAEAVTIMNENNEAPDMGYRGGLSVTMPSYPDSCEQVLQWEATGMGLHFSISSTTQTGQSCGLTTMPSTTDFAAGFDASVIGVWTATNATVPVTVTLTKS